MSGIKQTCTTAFSALKREIARSTRQRSWRVVLLVTGLCLIALSVTALVIEYPTNQTTRQLRLVVTKAPGGLAVDKHGNIYYSDQGSGAGSGKIMMIPKETNIPIVLLDHLNQPGDVELSADQRALVFVEDGNKIQRYYFGVSAQFQDADGVVLDGLTVYVNIPGVGVGKSINTMTDNFYTLFDCLDPANTTNNVELMVEKDGKAARFAVTLGQNGEKTIFGQTIKYFNVTL